ncbi:Type 1 pili tip component [Pseudomonas savastanoi pv. glycinea]|nr:Type 1 pili tip component [Pseudomonas savastanoi pv. glycinea]
MHRQLCGQVVHITQIQVSRHPARQQQHFTGNYGRDVRVAVTVSAHPGGKADRRGFQRQIQAGRCVQCMVSLAQVVRNGVPEGVLDNRKTPFGLINRRGTDTPYLFGMPGLGDQTLQARGNLCALGAVEVAMIERGQLRSDGVVFLNERTACNFGGVSRQHQLDFQLAQLARQGIRRVTFRFQAVKQLGQHPRLKGQRLGIVTAMHELILLGNIGQVEKLVERTGHRQEFVITQPVDTGAELLGTFCRTAPARLGAFANTFDLVEEFSASLLTNRVTQQLTQQVNVFAQTRIDIGHRSSPVFCLGSVAYPQNSAGVREFESALPTVHQKPAIGQMVQQKAAPQRLINPAATSVHMPINMLTAS